MSGGRGLDLEQRFVNLDEGVRGTRAVLRGTVSANDAEITTAQALANLSTSRYAIVEAVLSGTSSVGATLRPLYWNSLTSSYMKGEDRAILASTGAAQECFDRSVFIIPTLNVTDFYIKLGSITGTNPLVTIYVTPYGY